MIVAVNWTTVLVYGVPAYIAALGGATAAVIGSLNRRSLKTSNGKTIAEAVEATHAAVSAGVDTLNTLSDDQAERHKEEKPSG